jgi:hypothetical protein
MYSNHNPPPDAWQLESIKNRRTTMSRVQILTLAGRWGCSVIRGRREHARFYLRSLVTLFRRAKK